MKMHIIIYPLFSLRNNHMQVIYTLFSALNQMQYMNNMTDMKDVHNHIPSFQSAK